MFRQSCTLFLLCCAALFATAISAQAQVGPIGGPVHPLSLNHQVYLSVRGNDSMNCGSPEAACRTLERALAMTPAGGVVTIMDSGDFGTGEIAKSMTITSADGSRPTVYSKYAPFTINAGFADTVMFRGLTIKSTNTQASGGGTRSTPTVTGDDNADTGINFNYGGALVISDVTVIGFGVGVSVGILPCASNAAACRLPVGYQPADVYLENCRLFNNAVGLKAGGYASRIAIAKTAAFNNGVGFQMAASALNGMEPRFAMENCTAYSNDTGIYFDSEGALSLMGSNVWGNQIGVDNRRSSTAFVRPTITELKGVYSVGNNINNNGTNINGTLRSLATQ